MNLKIVGGYKKIILLIFKHKKKLQYKHNNVASYYHLLPSPFIQNPFIRSFMIHAMGMRASYVNNIKFARSKLKACHKLPLYVFVTYIEVQIIFWKEQ